MLHLWRFSNHLWPVTQNTCSVILLLHCKCWEGIVTQSLGPSPLLVCRYDDMITYESNMSGDMMSWLHPTRDTGCHFYSSLQQCRSKARYIKHNKFTTLMAKSKQLMTMLCIEFPQAMSWLQYVGDKRISWQQYADEKRKFCVASVYLLGVSEHLWLQQKQQQQRVRLTTPPLAVASYHTLLPPHRWQPMLFALSKCIF